MKTAAQSRKESNEAAADKLSKQLAALDKQISAARKRGDTSISGVFPEWSSGDLRRELQRLGYKITQGSGDYRDEACYTLSW